MKRISLMLMLVTMLGMATLDADAARRFGGGGNIGKQRSAPTATKEATPPPASSPTQAAPTSTAPAATPSMTPPPKPSFMSRWGGMLAGLGIGALLGSLFGAQMGPFVGLLLAGLLGVIVISALFRMFAGRRTPMASTGPQTQPAYAEAPRTTAFQGIGSAIPGNSTQPTPAANERAIAIPGFEVGPFVRVAKTSFIRLQAANDAGDLDDIRDYTTPEMYAEISMQLKERGRDPQRTEVVSLDADVVEAVVEGDYEIASVRFRGLIRENDAANPEPFDEIWHVRKKAGDQKAPWLIAGIQQAA